MEFNNQFKLVYKELSKNYKVTEISNSLGYTTTSQLYNVLNGKSTIVSKALYKLFNNFNVNPNFIFLGIGDIFNNNINYIEQVEKLQIELNDVNRLNQELYTQNRKLIDITHNAIDFK